MAHVLLFWYEERQWSAHPLDTIEEPRLPLGQYTTGMKVRARYQGKLCPSIILGISDDRSALKDIALVMGLTLQRQETIEPPHQPGPHPFENVRIENIINDVGDGFGMKLETSTETNVSIESLRTSENSSEASGPQRTSQNTREEMADLKEECHLLKEQVEHLQKKLNDLEDITVPSLKEDCKMFEEKISSLYRKLEQHTDKGNSAGTLVTHCQTNSQCSTDVRVHTSEANIPLESNKQNKTPVEGMPASHTFEELLASIRYMESLHQCVFALLNKLFDREYILSHSVSGRRSNTKYAAKPQFDQKRYSLFVQVIKHKFPTVRKSDLTAKVIGTQKKLIRMKQDEAKKTY